MIGVDDQCDMKEQRDEQGCVLLHGNSLAIYTFEISGARGDVQCAMRGKRSTATRGNLSYVTLEGGGWRLDETRRKGDPLRRVFRVLLLSLGIACVAPSERMVHAHYSMHPST